MASLNGFGGNVTGTSGSVGLLEPKGSWKVYIFPRGAHADAASTGTTINFDSSDAAGRFSANDWVQVGTDNGKIRQVTAVGGDSITVNTAVTVAANDRVFRIGSTQPTTTNSITTYQPNTTIYLRDDDGATPVTNSQLTTDTNGLFQFWAADNLYDAMAQDANGTNQFGLIDIAVGAQVATSFAPIIGRSEDLGSCAKPWDNFTYSGEIISAVTSATGATSHRFDTCGGVTQGNLFAFQNNNVTQVYGDTRGGILHSWTLPQVFNVKSARYGATGDGTTDDTTAIQSAITDATGASDGAGGIVFFPPGTYIVTSTLRVKSRCTLLGSGARITVIKAGAGFTFNGTTDAVITIGEAGTDSYGKVRELTVDCNDVASSIAIFYLTAQENAGARDCNVVRYRAGGIVGSTNFQSQNFSIMNCEFFHSASAASNASGISVTQSSGGIEIDNCTFNAYDGAAQIDGPAINIGLGTQATLRRIHIERNTVAVHGDSTAYGTAVQINSGTGVRDAFRIDGPGWMLLDVGGATIHDSLNGISWNENAPNWYFLSNTGGVGAKSRFSSHQSAPSQLASPTTFGNTLTVSGAFGVTGSFFGNSMVIATVGTATTFPAGRILGVSTSPAGSTSITSITTTGNNGRRVTLLGVAGTATITQGTGIRTDGASIALAPGHMVEFECIGTTWYQVSAKLDLGGL